MEDSVVGFGAEVLVKMAANFVVLFVNKRVGCKTVEVVQVTSGLHGCRWKRETMLVFMCMQVSAHLIRELLKVSLSSLSITQHRVKEKYSWKLLSIRR